MPNRDLKGRFIKGHTVNQFPFEEMQRYTEAYIVHRTNGQDKPSFSRNGCDYRTVENWLDTMIVDAQTGVIDIEKESIMQPLRMRTRDAEAKGLLMWETLAFNVAFGLEADILMPTKDDPNKTQTIKPTHSDPRLIMFLLRAKNPEV